MENGSRDLELLLIAVQQGVLNEKQVEECLREWEERHGSRPGAVGSAALDSGILSKQRIRELAARRDPGATAVRVDVVMGCSPCGKEKTLPLEEALRKPRCIGCSGFLRFRRQAGIPGVRVQSGPLPEDARAAAADPKNRFGKYLLVRKLGSGGMGEVVLAWDTVLSRWTALKFPRTVGEDDLRRLYLEAQGAGGLSHPNIASVFEIAEIEGRHYIAMPYIEGRTADALMAEQPDTREIARWIRDAARGLHYAHEKGVIHRDLKPSNLMIDVERRVYLMDFGLAKMMGGAGGGTVSGVILGTPAFMPPEQAAGNAGQIDRRSDVYSLGATLYTLLAGRRPFEGESATDILVQILTTEPLGIRRVRPDLPWELEAIIERAMARARDQRYDSAKELADDLERFLEQQPIAAKRATITRRLRRKVARHRGVLLAAAAGALLISLAGGLLGAFRRTEPAPDPSRRLADWTALLGQLRGLLTLERFDEARARELLGRVDREFPDQKAAADALVEDESRRVAAWLETLPRSEWLAARERALRARAWLAFAGRPVAAADRVAAWKGTCTILLHVEPWAELAGPWAAALPGPERRSPLALRDVEILDAPLELSHPGLGAQKSVPLPALKPGAVVLVEGRWDRPDSIQAIEAP
jgi:hypothetical protein